MSEESTNETSEIVKATNEASEDKNKPQEFIVEQPTKLSILMCVLMFITAPLMIWYLYSVLTSSNSEFVIPVIGPLLVAIIIIFAILSGFSNLRGLLNSAGFKEIPLKIENGILHAYEQSGRSVLFLKDKPLQLNFSSLIAQKKDNHFAGRKCVKLSENGKSLYLPLGIKFLRGELSWLLLAIANGASDSDSKTLLISLATQEMAVKELQKALIEKSKKKS